MTPRETPSTLGPVIARYVALRTALGRRYTLERRVLESLDAFLQDEGGRTADLTPERFARWIHTLLHLTPTVRRNRLRIVRNLCLYRRRTEPACFVPDPATFPAPLQPGDPYIFTADEIARIIHAAHDLTATVHCPLRPQVFRMALVLLYAAGLRRGFSPPLTQRTWSRRNERYGWESRPVIG